MFNLSTCLVIFLLFLSCCLNVVSLEHMMKLVPSAGSTISFFQFTFIAFEGLVFYSKFFRTPRKIPLQNYLWMILLFFSSTITNMMALSSNIPMPLHMIFKSGSLVANMLMGYLVLGKTYEKSKTFSVILVSIGICICTFTSKSSNEDMNVSLMMLLGICFMIFSLITSARLGVYQESIFSTYGKHTREAAFYNHIIPLPIFIFLAPSIIKNIILFNETSTYSLLGFQLPIMWYYLSANLVTQYICIRCVFKLSAELSSLTVTLLVTLRKFLSLVISVVYFGNYFATSQWFGACCVLTGTLIYTGLLPLHQFSFLASKDKKKD